jgi:hypothetical protein
MSSYSLLIGMSPMLASFVSAVCNHCMALRQSATINVQFKATDCIVAGLRLNNLGSIANSGYNFSL